MCINYYSENSLDNNLFVIYMNVSISIHTRYKHTFLHIFFACWHRCIYRHTDPLVKYDAISFMKTCDLLSRQSFDFLTVTYIR